MAIAGSIRSGSDGKYPWRRAPLAFPGVNEGAGVGGEDAGSDRDEIQLLELGADKVSLNRSAVAEPLLVARAAERFGSQCMG